MLHASKKAGECSEETVHNNPEPIDDGSHRPAEEYGAWSMKVPAWAAAKVKKTPVVNDSGYLINATTPEPNRAQPRSNQENESNDQQDFWLLAQPIQR